METQVKGYGDEVTDFYDKKIPKVDFNYTCLAVFSVDSALNKDGNQYPQVFWKNVNILKKVIRHVVDDLENSPDDTDEK